jgi:hypothetical protein
MPLSITVLRTELRDHLGLDEDELPPEDADSLLNRSWWEVMDKFNFREKEAKTSFQTVAGIHIYSMPQGYDALQLLSIGGSNNNNLLGGQFYLNGGAFLNPTTSDETKHTQLDRIDDKWFEDNYDDDVDEYGQPVRYYRYGSGIVLNPTPDAVYNVNVSYLITLADLSNTNEYPPVPQSWHEVILYGAVWRGFMRMGDYNRKQAAQATQIGLINSMTPVAAKEEADSSMAGLQFYNGRSHPTRRGR